MFSRDLLYKTLMFLVGLVCYRRTSEIDRIQTKDAKEKRETKAERKEGAMRKKQKNKGAEKRDVREQHCRPSGVQVGGFTWRGQLRLQCGDTHRGLMEGLGFSTSFQLSLST